MSNTNNSQAIIESLEKVEHPAIATSLLDLGMLRDIEVTPGLKTSLTMVLPFPNIPDNVRDYMVTSLANAAKSAGGALTKVDMAVMNEEERQNFLKIEQENWRG
ncbi:MAG: iron-sulfur cluster assembly protein [Chloroflexota bacterium]